MANLHAQLLQLLHAFRRYGVTDSGGLTRLAASSEERQARDFLSEWLLEHGFTRLVDPAGNLFGLLDLGEQWPERYFFCGSHLDSQPEGGHYDGVLGVVCACIGALSLKSKIVSNELQPGFRYYVVACWAGEEGTRFQPSLLGSSVFCGKLALADAYRVTDVDGVHYEDALKLTGYLGADEIPRPDRYLEIHIEQASTLQREGIDIGLVGACWGASKLRVIVTGRADHTGPTPMEERRNALLAAAHLIIEVEAISARMQASLYSSVGRLEVSPNSPNTVAERVELWIEFRSVDREALGKAHARLNDVMADIEQRTGCVLNLTSAESREPIEFDPDSLQLAKNALAYASIPYRELDTVAGHDAISLQTICPTSLLFVPSKDGVSHSPLEFTSDEQICAGFDAMTAVLTSQIAGVDCGQIPRSMPI